MIYECCNAERMCMCVRAPVCGCGGTALLPAGSEPFAERRQEARLVGQRSVRFGANLTFKLAADTPSSPAAAALPLAGVVEAPSAGADDKPAGQRSVRWRAPTTFEFQKDDHLSRQRSRSGDEAGVSGAGGQPGWLL